MIFSKYQNSFFTAASFTAASGRCWRRILLAPIHSTSIFTRIFAVAIALSLILLTNAPPALATLTDDRYDGTIFALYGGNGSLVPPKSTIADALQREKPVLLIFYTDDSRDCKQYATVVSQLQQFYGRAASFIPLTIDSFPNTPSPDPKEPSHYYEGFVPQTVILDRSGKVVFNAKGQVPFEEVDDAFRKVFDLLPREKSVPLKRRAVNELNTELSK